MLVRTVTYRLSLVYRLLTVAFLLLTFGNVINIKILPKKAGSTQQRCYRWRLGKPLTAAVVDCFVITLLRKLHVKTLQADSRR